MTYKLQGVISIQQATKDQLNRWREEGESWDAFMLELLEAAVNNSDSSDDSDNSI